MTNHNRKNFYILLLIFLGISSFFTFSHANGKGWALEVKIPGTEEGQPYTNPGDYIRLLYLTGAGIAAVLAVAVIVWAGFVWMTAPAIESIQQAKARIWGAIAGLILLLASWLILYTINPELVSLNPPGLEGLNLGTTDAFDNLLGGGGGGGTGGDTGGGGGGQYTGNASNANSQKVIDTFNKNPGAYAQTAGACATYTGYLQEDTFGAGRSTFHQFGYNSYNYPMDGSLSQPLIDRWGQDLQNGILPNPRINGEGSGQHWIILLSMNNDNITFYDPNLGRIRTLPTNAPGANGGYFFGSSTAYSGHSDRWGGYITVP